MNEFPAYHSTALVLFREKLYLKGNEAVERATRDGHKVCPVLLPVPTPVDQWPERLKRIEEFKQTIEQDHGHLFISDIDVNTYLQRVIRLTSSNTVYWNKSGSAAGSVRDDRLRLYLGSASIETHIVSHNSAVETPPAAMSMAGNWQLDDIPHPPELLFWQPGPTTTDRFLASLTSLNNLANPRE